MKLWVLRLSKKGVQGGSMTAWNGFRRGKQCMCRERAARRASFRRLGWGYLAWRMTPEQSSRGRGPPWGLRRPCARTLNSMCLLMTTLEWGEYRQLWGIWECREEKSWKRLPCWEERESSFRPFWVTEHRVPGSPPPSWRSWSRVVSLGPQHVRFITVTEENQLVLGPHGFAGTSPCPDRYRSLLELPTCTLCLLGYHW